MRIIAVRHGETVENTKHIMMGHQHGTLTKKGIGQAKKVGKFLKNRKIDLIYSSDLGHVKATLKEIAKYHDVPITYTKALREQNYGVFQGKHLSEFLKAEQKSGRSRLNFRPKNGESFLDLHDRAKKFLSKLAIKHNNKTVLILAHSGTLRSIASKYLKVPLADSFKKHTRNTGFVIIDVNKKKSKLVEDRMFK